LLGYLVRYTSNVSAYAVRNKPNEATDCRGASTDKKRDLLSQPAKVDDTIAESA